MHKIIKLAMLSCSLLLTPSFASEMQARIIGGYQSDQGAHPWMVAVATKNSSNEFNSTFCGATLIHAQWAITAAHCMFYGENNTPLNNSQIELYIGTHVLDDGQAQHHDVSAIIVHPSYDSSTFQHDIALLRLSTPSSQAVAHLAAVKPGAGYTVLTAGWGRLNEIPIEGGSSPGNFPHALYEVNVITLDNTQCDQGQGLLDSHLCAGIIPGGGKDSCSGDSGGPLILNNQGQETLVGIVSYGYGCAQAGYPGIYTSVASYRDWIAEKTIDPSTGSSAVPAPNDVDINTPTATGTKTNTGTDAVTSTSSGGAIGLLFLLLPLLRLGRLRSKPSPVPAVRKHI